MAKGAQDWVARTDILLQTLTELIVRYKYGAAKSAYFGAVVEANKVTTLCSIAGKGIIYVGKLDVGHTASQKDAIIKMAVDGEDFASPTFYGLFTNSYTKYGDFLFHLNRYDEVDYQYSISFLGGITFETSLVVTYEETQGQTPPVYLNLVYALI
jgi:hypothetical protein